MKVSLVQMELTDSKVQNLEKALSYVEEISGSDLAVFPEMLMGARTEETELYHMAEDIRTGEFASALSEAAARYEVTLCAGLWETGDADKVYSTAAVYGPEGGLRARYRKLHLFDALSVKESDFMLRGEELPPVFECGGVMCGLSICYDLRFPEVYRSQSVRGAELLIVPAAWYAGDMKIDHLHTLAAARALENTCYCACADLCGESFAGNTAAYGPFGHRLGYLGASEGVLSFEADPAEIKSVREKLPCLRNFRDDIL